MADEEVYEGVDGLQVRLSFVDPAAGTPRNVGDGTVEVVLQRPDGSTITLADELEVEGDPAAGVVLGTLEDLHLTQVGTYRMQGWLTNLLGTFPSNIETFRIRRSLPRT